MNQIYDEIKKYVRENKKSTIITLLVIFIGFPLIFQLLSIIISPFVLLDHLNLPILSVDSNIASNGWIDYWGSFFGALVGAGATILAVRISIIEQRKVSSTENLEQKEELIKQNKLKVRPYLAYDTKELNASEQVYFVDGAIEINIGENQERLTRHDVEAEFLLSNIGIGSLINCRIFHDKETEEELKLINMTINSILKVSLLCHVNIEHGQVIADKVSVTKRIVAKYEDLIETKYVQKYDIDMMVTSIPKHIKNDATKVRYFVEVKNVSPVLVSEYKDVKIEVSTAIAVASSAKAKVIANN